MSVVDRKFERRVLGQQCWIEVPSSRGPLPVRMQDVSVGGARLVLDDPTLVPDVFVLRFSLTVEGGRKCAVRRREAKALGVEFVR